VHTIVVVCASLLVLAAYLLLGYAWAGGPPGIVLGALVFIPCWLVGAFTNMYLGVQQGYSWTEEIPIFLGIFAFPSLLAAWVWWKFG
jgi:hypothetical protein